MEILLCICDDYLNPPIVEYSCGCYFCKECSDKFLNYLRVNRRKSGSRIACPKCKEDLGINVKIKFVPDVILDSIFTKLQRNSFYIKKT